MKMDINVQEDLNAVNDNITKLVDELNKVNAARENIIQQVQNLNGVAMYLRGKMPQTETPSVLGERANEEEVLPEEIEEADSLERENEYPDTV